MIEFFEDNRIELYNLKDDIAERTNLAAANSDKGKELKRMLQDRRVRVNAPIPTTPNPDFDPESLMKPQPTGKSLAGGKSRKKGQQP